MDYSSSQQPLMSSSSSDPQLGQMCISLIVLDLHCCVWAFSSCGKRGYCSLQFTGFSLWWLCLLQSIGCRHMGFNSCITRAQQLMHTGSRPCRLQQLRCAGSAFVAHRLQSTDSEVVAPRLSCSVACGIFLARDQTSVPYIGR